MVLSTLVYLLDLKRSNQKRLKASTLSQGGNAGNTGHWLDPRRSNQKRLKGENSFSYPSDRKALRTVVKQSEKTESPHVLPEGLKVYPVLGVEKQSEKTERYPPLLSASTVVIISTR